MSTITATNDKEPCSDAVLKLLKTYGIMNLRRRTIITTSGHVVIVI